MNLPSLAIGTKRARYCIIQGGMAIRIALHKLVAAVANSGGIGTFGGTAISPSELQEEIRKARLLSRGIIGVNLMLASNLFDRLLETCIKERVDFVAIGAGFARGPFQKLAQAGIPGVAIVSSEKAARIAGKTVGVEGIVVESGHAGGHLGPEDPSISTWELFPRVFKYLKNMRFTGPIIAAGGILSRQDIERALAMGADGVQLGTRFAVSEESAASPEMKQAWLNATGSQLTFWSPTGMPSRVIVPHKADKLPRIGSDHLGCLNCLKICSHRNDHTVSHCIRKALLNAQRGDVKHGLVFSGIRVGEIKEILSVKEIFRRLQLNV